jgi:hypothetical protein
LDLFYACKTRALTSRQEHRLRIFLEQFTEGISGRKRDEITSGWRKLNNEELHNLYLFSNIIRMIKSRKMIRNGNVERMGEKRYIYRILVGEVERERSLRRLARTQEDNITKDLR